MGTERRWWESGTSDYILKAFDITLERATDPTTQKNSDVRKALSYYLKYGLSLSHEEIGKLLGGRSHSTITVGLKKFDEYAEIYPRMRRIKDLVDAGGELHKDSKFVKVIAVLEATKDIEPDAFVTAIRMLKRLDSAYGGETS